MKISRIFIALFVVSYLIYCKVGIAEEAFSFFGPLPEAPKETVKEPSRPESSKPSESSSNSGELVIPVITRVSEEEEKKNEEVSVTSKSLNTSSSAETQPQNEENSSNETMSQSEEVSKEEAKPSSEESSKDGTESSKEVAPPKEEENLEDKFVITISIPRTVFLNSETYKLSPEKENGLFVYSNTNNQKFLGEINFDGLYRVHQNDKIYTIAEKIEGKNFTSFYFVCDNDKSFVVITTTNPDFLKTSDEKSKEVTASSEVEKKESEEVAKGMQSEPIILVPSVPSNGNKTTATTSRIKQGSSEIDEIIAVPSEPIRDEKSTISRTIQVVREVL